MLWFKDVGLRLVRATMATSCCLGREYSCSMAGTVAATHQTVNHCPGLNNKVAMAAQTLTTGQICSWTRDSGCDGRMIVDPPSVVDEWLCQSEGFNNFC